MPSHVDIWFGIGPALGFPSSTFCEWLLFLPSLAWPSIARWQPLRTLTVLAKVCGCANSASSCEDVIRKNKILETINYVGKNSEDSYQISYFLEYKKYSEVAAKFRSTCYTWFGCDGIRYSVYSTYESRQLCFRLTNVPSVVQVWAVLLRYW